MEPERAYCRHCQVQPEPEKDLREQSPWPTLEGKVLGVCVGGCSRQFRMACSRLGLLTQGP